MTAQFSASLGTESSQSWILHFSFSWVGFPSTSSSVWAVYCFPAVHGGFLVHVQHLSSHSRAAEITRKKPYNYKTQQQSTSWGTFADLLKSEHSPRWDEETLTAQAGSRPAAKEGRYQTPLLGTPHVSEGLPQIWALQSNLNSLSTVPQIWFRFEFSC